MGQKLQMHFIVRAVLSPKRIHNKKYDQISNISRTGTLYLLHFIIIAPFSKAIKLNSIRKMLIRFVESCVSG